MPALTVPLTGDELLAAVTEAMVAVHERYHHRKPVTAKTMPLDDELLACVRLVSDRWVGNPRRAYISQMFDRIVPGSPLGELAPSRP